MVGEIEFEKESNVKSCDDYYQDNERDKKLFLEVDEHGFTTIRNPILMAEINQAGRVDIAMQPFFQKIAVPELKVKVSSYFIIDSESEIKTMYEKILSMHRANLAGIVTINQTPGNSSPGYKSNGLKLV
jgi:hypothetical protein